MAYYEAVIGHSGHLATKLFILGIKLHDFFHLHPNWKLKIEFDSFTILVDKVTFLSAAWCRQAIAYLEKET